MQTALPMAFALEANFSPLTIVIVQLNSPASLALLPSSTLILAANEPLLFHGQS